MIRLRKAVRRGRHGDDGRIGRHRTSVRRNNGAPLTLTQPKPSSGASFARLALMPAQHHVGSGGPRQMPRRSTKGLKKACRGYDIVTRVTSGRRTFLGILALCSDSTWIQDAP